MPSPLENYACWPTPTSTHVEKKQRVAVLRAVVKQYPQVTAIRGGRTWVFFVSDNVQAYGMARLKPSPLTNAEIREQLLPGGEYHGLLIEGGSWWWQVEQLKAARDGDVRRWQDLEARRLARIAAIEEELSIRSDAMFEALKNVS